MKLISSAISFPNLPLKQLKVLIVIPTLPNGSRRTPASLKRLVKTATVIHKFTKIPCSTEQHDSSADHSNISIQTGFGAEAINILAIFPASEHKDSFTALIK